MSVSATVDVTGGYGEYQYRYDIDQTEEASEPSASEEFGEGNQISWSNRFYCNGQKLVVTVRDEAGNEATASVVIG